MMKNTFLFVGLILIPIILDSLFHKYWKKRWMRFSQIGVHHSTQAMKVFWGIPALVSVSSLITIGLIMLWHFVKPEFSVHWSGWVFVSVMIFIRLEDAFNETSNFFAIKNGPKVEVGLYQYESQLLKKGSKLHNKCYICEKGGHSREMVLIGKPGYDYLIKYVLNDPIKSWSPTQGCFECKKCGRLVCYTHSDVDKRCDCGACDWQERTYVQIELDNEETETKPLLNSMEQRQPSASTNKSGIEPFVKGLLKNDLSLVKQGIKAGVDVNMLLGEGGETTPLIFSAHKGNYDVCSVLLEAGADPNQRNKREHLALCEVLANTKLSLENRLHISKFLLDHGADPNGLDWGRPALQFALESEQLVSLLMAYRTDINKVSEYHELAGPRQGENFLYHENTIRYACKIGAMPEVIKVLLDAGADPLLPNSEGDTAWDFVSNFLHKAPSEPIPSGREGSVKRMLLQARTTLYEDTAKLLKPIVLDARFDLFISSDKSSGWGEFYRGRLEQTGKRIWSSELLKRRLPYYGEVMETHISHALAAVVFLSPMHFSADQGSTERKRELDALVKRFSSMPEKLLIVTSSEESKDLLTKHPELKPFPSFHLETGKVNELWATLAALCGLSEIQREDAFQDLRQIGRPSYDCFISYRTVSVHTVRFLAEQLVARGVKLWLAEWEIMVSGRRDFQESINHGIASSSKVICCTNSGYAQSDYCQIEAMQVLDVPGKESRHILDLRLPNETNSVSEALQKYGSESVIHDEQTLQKTWESCCRFLGVQSSTLPDRTIDGISKHFEVAGNPFQIAMDAKWVIRPVGKQIRGGNTVIAFFSQKIGSVALEGELVVGPWAISLPGQTDINDRDMSEAIITTLREWNRHGKILYPKGVHVVHIPALHTASKVIAHPAFTYLDSGADSGEQDKGLRVPLSDCTWHRKYSIRVTPPHMPSEMEFCFDFDMRGVAYNDFATFCRYAYMMDDLVRGLSFKEKGSQQLSGNKISYPMDSTNKNSNMKKIITDILDLARSGNVQKLLSALDHGNFDVNKHDSGDGATALHIAAGFGRTECVQLLLDRGAEIDAVDNEKWTPLHYASAKGHLLTVRILLDKDADIEAQMWDGGNALHMAAKEGHVEIVKELIERGAKRDVPVINGQTALDLAVMRGQDSVVTYFRSLHKTKVSLDTKATATAMEDISVHRQGKTSDAKTSESVVSQEHDVFLSYSSKNKQTADAICHVLEQNKIKCWIAPRDISIGEKYGNVIEKAICACKVFIIVFSKESSLSPWVESELNLAFNERRVIMPFRIDNTNIEGEMRLILNNRHWIDAYPEPEVHFAKLVSAVARQVGLPLSSFNSSFPNDIIQQTQDTKLRDEDTDSEKQKEH